MSNSAKPKRDTITRRGSTILVEDESKGRVGSTGSSRTPQRPQWTMQELAYASAGVPELPFLAACYAFAGDRSKFWTLHEGLMGHARMFCLIYSWPREVLDFHGIQKPYLAHLCKLVMDEDASPAIFHAAPALYPIYLGITESMWDRQIKDRFREIKHTWNDWLGQAARMIQARLSDYAE